MEAFEVRQNVGEPTYIRIEGDWVRYDRFSVDGSVCFLKDLPQLKTYECPCDYLYSAVVSDEREALEITKAFINYIYVSQTQCNSQENALVILLGDSDVIRLCAALCEVSNYESPISVQSPTYTSGYPLMRALSLDYPDYRIESVVVTGHVKELQQEGRITLKNGSYITVIHEDYYDRFMELHSTDDKDEPLTGVSPEALQTFLNGGMI